MKKLVCVLGITAVMVGCTTQQPLHPEGHRLLGRQMAAVDVCYHQDMLTSQEVAYARELTRQRLTHAIVNQELYQQQYSLGVQELSPATAEQCKKLSASLAQVQLQQAQAAEQSRQWQEAIDSAAKIGPKNTYCNSIGTMTNCTSY